MQLARIHGGEAHVELAHIADVTPQLRDLQETVRIVRGAARESRVQGGRQRTCVGGIDVEHNAGPIKDELGPRRVPGGFRGADARGAQPGKIQWQITQ